MIVYDVVFKGRVQGVGFRYTARDLARASGITGRVKNCPDGSVSLLVEGPEEAVRAMLDCLKGQFAVRDMLVTSLPLSGRYTDFTVEY
ncbi:MAG: acylphosphatase [Candidatus Omnitrophota bacterium]